MPRNATTGVYARVVNSFSQPVFGTLIDPVDADAYFDDLDVGLNPAQLDGPVRIIDTLQVGSTGTAAGTIEFFNATSGSIIVSPPTGALGSVTLTLPDLTDTLVSKNSTDILTNKTFVAPVLGSATATTINKVTITAPATNAVLTLIDGTTLTGPTSSGTVMTLGNNETVTGVKTFGSAGAVSRFAVAGNTSGSTIVNATAIASGVLTLPAATDTLVGKATTDILTNKTFDSAGTGNVLQVSGVTVSRGQYPGVATTTVATAGNIGEVISSTVLVGAAVALTTGVPANVTSLSLTAGHWQIFGTVCFAGGTSTSITSLEEWISATSATNPTFPNNGALYVSRYAVTLSSGQDALTACVGPLDVHLSGTTTYFLTAQGNFTVSTLSAFGFMQAIRCQ